MQPLGGSWYLEHVKSVSFGGHSAPAHKDLRRKRGKRFRAVDTWLEHARFYPPDCVAWAAGRTGMPWYFACGDRRPIELPSWVLSAGPQGLIGGYVTRAGVESWELLPLDSVLPVALRAPPYEPGWIETIQPGPLPKVWVNYQPHTDDLKLR